MNGVSKKTGALQELPGFRFQPTDEELVSFYLHRRLHPAPGDSVLPLLSLLIPDIDIYRYDPWDLPQLARLGEGPNGCYFFSPRGKKYQNSARPNRVTLTGFWKATGTDKLVYSSSLHTCIGLKKSLVFYHGRASKSTKGDWIMHEFRLPSREDSTEHNACWALCKIFRRKSNNSQHTMLPSSPPLAKTNISHSLESFEANECNEKDKESNCTSLNLTCNGSLTSSIGLQTPSSHHIEVKESTNLADLETPTDFKTNSTPTLMQKAPLTIGVSKSKYGWSIDDLFTSWLSPIGMKPSSQPCSTTNESLPFSEQLLQDNFRLEGFCPLVSPQFNPVLPLWD